MRATAIWVRWQGGWRYIDDEDAPLVIQISQGHSGDGAEVVRKAQAELATYGSGQTELTVGVAPGSLDGLIEGDEVNVDGSWQEIEAFTAALDDASGVWTDIPQFGVVLDVPEQRIARTFRSLGGLNGGTSHLARPVASVAPDNVKP